MRSLTVWIFAALTAAAASPQDKPEQWQPSPMEAFAQQPDTHITWSSEIGSLEADEVRVALTALILEDKAQPPKQMRGVRVDLSRKNAADRIYLDETAVTRTIKALGESEAGMARAWDQGRIGGNSCFGAAEFWPGYNWPWNKYHELNADYCLRSGEAYLSLSGRHKPGTFQLADERPERLAELLATALDQLKTH